MMKKKKRLLFLLIIFVGLIPKLTLAETFEGEYSIDYLLRNYSAVTLGIKDSKISKDYLKIWYYDDNDINIKTGDIKNVTNIDGAILVNGDYTSYNYSLFGSESDNVKSFIKGSKGNNITTNSQLVMDSNYIDFYKLYSQIISESKALVTSTTYYINNEKIEISKPGIYTINNTARDLMHIVGEGYENNGILENPILIKDYISSDVYIFNMLDQYVPSIPNIYIIESGTANRISLKEYIENNNYTGNIIFNFPNARWVNLGKNFNYNILNNDFSGSIIAPQADVFLYYNSYGNRNEKYYSSIIANSILGYEMDISIEKSNYKVNKKIVNEKEVSSIKEVIDYEDDYYARDYSISDLLKNYNLVTLGHKQIDFKSKLLEYGNKPGSIKMFHITGQVLINGDLYGNVHNDANEYNYQTIDRIAFDLESNEVTESYIKGNVNKIVQNGNGSQKSISHAFIQNWDNMKNDNIQYKFRKNTLFIDSSNINFYSDEGSQLLPINNYINFDRLYNNIISEQKAIEKGTSITPSDKKAHIKTGGSYAIDDINDIDEIIFDNFEDNKNKITVITIKNEGDISFPLISKDTGSYKGIVTNDYYGKENATHLYEQDTFVQDSYHGNIIWNIPNATYIKLKENAPFAGHLIAPNADVETPETHFAGCFIVNSIYGEGNTEAHFYPLTATATYDVPEYDDLTKSEKATLGAMRLKRLLGGSASTIETTVLGDETEFRKEEAKLNEILDKEQNKTSNNTIAPIIDILQNPLTKRSVLIIGSILTIISVTIYFTFKKKA